MHDPQTSQLNDHDLIPDEWQPETELPHAYKPPQKPQKPAVRPEEDKDELTEDEKPHEPLKKSEWMPIDLSHGTFRDPELFKNREHLRHNLMKDLKPVLRDFSKRKEVTVMLLNKKSHGLNKLEVKKGLRELKKEGKLSDFQVKKLRRKFGAF